MAFNDRILKACRCEPVDRTPVWLMRQAGRYLPEYRALREKHSILEMIRAPELAAEVTLQPIRRFALDAAIIFSDILPIMAEMGLDLEFISGKGPVFHNPIRRPEDIARLKPRAAVESLSYTLDAIRHTLASLNGTLPLIGFSGAPFTLACYAIEGGSSKDFLTARLFMYEQPKAWHQLMEIISHAVADYLLAQHAAGVHLVQLFDSWGGLLSPEDYRAYVMPHSQHVIARFKQETDIPVIHFATGASGLLPHIKEAGGDVIGADWRIDILEAWEKIGPDVAIQGNLDPALLLGPEETMKQSATAILDRVHGRPGHIFNLGHGVFKQTPPERVAALVDWVHGYENNL